MSIKDLIKRLSKIDNDIYLTDDFEGLMSPPVEQTQNDAEFSKLLNKLIDSYEDGTCKTNY